MKDKIIDFFRNVWNWILEHKKAVIAGVFVFVLLIVITACSTIGEADSVQFGFMNSSQETSNYGSDSV